MNPPRDGDVLVLPRLGVCGGVNECHCPPDGATLPERVEAGAVDAWRLNDVLVRGAVVMGCVRTWGAACVAEFVVNLEATELDTGTLCGAEKKCCALTLEFRIVDGLAARPEGLKLSRVGETGILPVIKLACRSEDSLIAC